MCLRVVKIDRRLVALVLLGSDVIAAVVAVDSDAAKGERFAGESSCCGCERSDRQILDAMYKVIRECVTRHRAYCSLGVYFRWCVRGACVDDKCTLPCE